MGAEHRRRSGGHHAFQRRAGGPGPGRPRRGRRGGGRRRPARSRTKPSQPGAAQDGEQQRQHHQASPPVDGGGQLADRVQHAANASRPAPDGSDRHAAPRRTAHWAPVTRSPPPPPRDRGDRRRDRRLVRHRRPRPAVAPARASTPGPCWSARSCCSRRPVARVEPVWREWLARWPTPAALAAATPADVIRAWGKLGYPRRALRLREAAVAVVERHGGVVPRDVAAAGGAARRRHLHRPGGRLLRLRAAAAGRGHQRAPGGGPAGARAGRGGQRPRRRPGRRRRADARRAGRGRSASRSPPWSSARWSAWPARRGAAPARSATGAPGGWPAARRTTGRRAGCRSSPAPTGRCAAGCSTCCGRRTRPVAAAALDAGLGRRRPALPLPGLPARRRPGRADRRRPVHPPDLDGDQET